VRNHLEAAVEEAREAAEHQRVEEPLAAAVERLLRDYFEAHGDSLPASGLHQRVLREVERPLLQLTLKATRGNQLKAAQVLGLNRNTLRKKIRVLKIEVPRFVK